MGEFAQMAHTNEVEENYWREPDNSRSRASCKAALAGAAKPPEDDMLAEKRLRLLGAR
jgi:hypothetical protein